MRTVIFGGSFDPVHTGHAMVANYVSQCGVADELWLMPSRLNPLKAGSNPADDRHRIEMCGLVARRCNAVEVSDFEFLLPSPSYTYDTLQNLRNSFPDREFMLLIGSDNWLCFDNWRNAEKIVAEFPIIIYPRPGYDIDPSTLPDSVELLKTAPQVLISSSFIRKGLAEGKNMSFFLPQDVLDYIKTHNLYV